MEQVLATAIAILVVVTRGKVKLLNLKLANNFLVSSRHVLFLSLVVYIYLVKLICRRQRKMPLTSHM